MTLISPLNHTLDSFVEALYSRLHRGKQHIQVFYRDWMRQGIKAPQDKIFDHAKELHQEIINNVDLSLLSCSTVLEEGLTKKLLFKTIDGLEIESVLLPMESGWTQCLSSQVGCRMGCTFCETGKIGLVRHLTTQEIIAQLLYSWHILKVKVRRVVFMGMGEPFDNQEAVFQAIRVLMEGQGIDFGGKQITISTSGRVDGIDALIQENLKVNLAISVNAPNDHIRRQLMPINRKWNMATLKEGLLRYATHFKKWVFVEYILIRGVTDDLEHAAALADYLEGLDCKVNVIPYNPQTDAKWEAPQRHQTDLFMNALRARGYNALLRGTKGQQLMAACGQLGNKELKKHRFER